MGDIKSAIEIALEKTKHLKLTEEESKQLKKEELKQKAEGLVYRYLSKQLDLEQLEKEINKEPEDTKESLFRFVLKHCVDSITMECDLKSILSGLGYFLRDKERETLLIKKIEASFNNYENKKANKYKQIAEELKEELKKEGFSGNAVLPNVESSNKWHHYLRDLSNRYQEEIAILKKKLIQPFK